MPNFQPLPTRLGDGVIATAPGGQSVFSGPDEELSLSPGLVNDEKVTVVGEPAIGAGRRWWRVRREGEAGFVWAVECDRDRYFLEPLNDGREDESASYTIHMVMKGEVWSVIATQYHTTIAALQQTNPDLVRPRNILYSGDWMRIPG